MASNKAWEVNKYNFCSGERLLFDANIWLYLFPAPSSGAQHGAKIYSAAFKAILLAKAHVMISSTILSEYVNRYCRIEWSVLYKQEFPDFKGFRKSKEYLAVGQAAGEYAEKILQFSTRLDDDFSSMQVPNIIRAIKDGSADLNDSFIVEMCTNHACKLVTHDGDFVNGGIEVLTGNGKLVAACG